MRLLRLLKALAGARDGVTFRALMLATKASKSSMNRYLKQLRGAGFLEKITLGGKARYRLSASVALGHLSDLQIAALLFAHQSVSSLRGSRLVKELDALVAPLSREDEVKSLVRLDAPLVDGALVDLIQEARLQRRRLTFQYWSARGDAPAARKADPLLLYLSSDNQAYLEAFDVDKQELRTFKLARISGLSVTEEAADEHPDFDPRKARPHTRKVWDAPAVEVTVLLDASKARFAREWPLQRQQTLLPQDDGSVLIKAKVAGIEEALKWVLSWGGGARVVAPISLQDAHRKELEEALLGYSQGRNR